MSFTDWLYSIIVKFFMFNKDIMRIEPKSRKNENFEKIVFKYDIKKIWNNLSVEISIFAKFSLVLISKFSPIHPYLLKESIIEPFVMSSIFRNCLSYSKKQDFFLNFQIWSLTHFSKSSFSSTNHKSLILFIFFYSESNDNWTLYILLRSG